MGVGNSASIGRQFNTLALDRTARETSKEKKVFGEGTDLQNSKRILSRTRRKLLSAILSLKLLALAEERGNAKLSKTFRNTYYCLSEITVGGGRLYGNYCKNKCCLVCTSIRRADIMNRYLPEILTWNNAHFVTLTCKAVIAKELPKLIKSINRGFSKILETYRKRQLRGKGFALRGIRSVECNFNPTKKTYNPHYHLIVPDKETGDILIREWLQRTAGKKTRWTVEQAQLNVPVNNIEKSLIEVIKYSTKVFTEPNPSKKHFSDKDYKIYVKPIYNILEAMQGIKLFCHFGFTLPKSSNENKSSTLLINPAMYDYDITTSDWVNRSDNSPLTKYSPDHWTNLMFREGIDDEKE